MKQKKSKNIVYLVTFLISTL